MGLRAVLPWWHGGMVASQNGLRTPKNS